MPLEIKDPRPPQDDETATSLAILRILRRWALLDAAPLGVRVRQGEDLGYKVGGPSALLRSDGSEIVGVPSSPVELGQVLPIAAYPPAGLFPDWTLP